jgi:hypothetical protein
MPTKVENFTMFGTSKGKPAAPWRVKLRTSFFSILLASLPSILFFNKILSAAPQDTDTSCADCPSYRGAFSIENETQAPVTYQMRWGEKNPWKQFVLPSRRIETHSYPLGEDKNKKIPIPQVRFDSLSAGFHQYDMQFYAVGYAGYGPSENTTKPKRYAFKLSSPRAGLDLFAVKY